jgi:Branched-chain amino acid transport system / permease component
LIVSRLPPKASGYFRTSYAQELALFETHTQKATFAGLTILLCVFPFLATPLQLEIVSQIFFATVGSLALMLLTGFAGQISLGHAGLIAAGAFTTGILAKEMHAPFWITLPASAAVGALLGILFGLPALRLRGLYLAISTLAQNRPPRAPRPSSLNRELNSRRTIVLCSRCRYIRRYWRATACPRAAHKTATYRNLRSPTGSANAIGWQKFNLRSDIGLHCGCPSASEDRLRARLWLRATGEETWIRSQIREHSTAAWAHQPRHSWAGAIGS